MALLNRPFDNGFDHHVRTLRDPADWPDIRHLAGIAAERRNVRVHPFQHFPASRIAKLPAPSSFIRARRDSPCFDR